MGFDIKNLIWVSKTLQVIVAKCDGVSAFSWGPLMNGPKR
jgi:hypothetical protein